MSWHVIRIFWLSLFALVLPMQALACLDAKPAHSPVTAPAALIQDLLHQSTERDPQPLSKAPATDTEYARSAVAILNSVRWHASERYQLSDSDADPLDTVAPFYPLMDSSLALRFVERTVLASYQDFHPSYRLSGWKETNAMYVALNSQYFH